MSRDGSRSRRQILRNTASTVAASAALIAGCVDQEGGENGEPDEGEEQILLETGDDVWIGQEPAEIEGEENPTLELVAGWRYEIGYVNRDGEEHSLEIRSDDEERDATTVDDAEGEERWLEVEATADLTSYRCGVHPETMQGEIRVDE
jgi:plastocyanin